MSSQLLVTALRPGYQLYKYTLMSKIRSGTFGDVWLAQDQAVGHTYAVKILKAGIAIDKGLREAHIGHVLNHNNVVRVHQADVISVSNDDRVVIAMDYMPDGPITKLANAQGFVRLPDAIRLGKDILRGLEYLHGHGFFHNDVKPGNVLIGPQNQGMLTDYGIVGVATEGGAVAPPAFYKIHAAPEVVTSNSINAQTDVFQAGLTLFRLLVGIDVLRHKFAILGEHDYNDATARDRLILTSDFPAFVPARLKRIVLKAVRSHATRRYQSAMDLRRKLERLSFPGYWTTNDGGELVGYNGSYSYRYEQTRRGNGGYDLTALKCSRSTARESRCVRYCHSDVTSAVVERKTDEFVKAVVEDEKPHRRRL